VTKAAPDIVNFDYRSPSSGTRRCQSPSESFERRRLDGLPRPSRLRSAGSRGEVLGVSSSSSVEDFDAVCRSVSVDRDTRLVQSAVTGDWRFVSAAAAVSPSRVDGDDPEPRAGSHSGPRRRRCCYNVRPQDMGVGVPPCSDLGVRSQTTGVETKIPPASSACPTDDFSSATSSTVVAPPEFSVDLVPGVHETASDVVLASYDDGSVTCLPKTTDELGASSNIAIPAIADRDVEGVVKSCDHHPELYKPFAGDTSCAGGESVSPLRKLDESATEMIPTSPCTVRSGIGVVLNWPDVTDKNEARSDDGTNISSPRGNFSAASGRGHGSSNVELVKNSALSTQFATDADLEADLLSARLLREFREAIKSAVDTIAAVKSRPEELDGSLPRYAAPRSNFASARSSLTVERVQQRSCDSLEGRSTASLVTGLSSQSSTRVESRTESALRQNFRMSNIPVPTLYGVNRCRRSAVVRDDLTTVTERRSAAAVPPSVLRHRRSLPDASQLRGLSSTLSPSRDAVMPARTNIRIRSSLVIGACGRRTLSINSRCNVR